MQITYHCKFCRIPGVVEIEDADADMFQIQKWKPLLTCNRCADYMQNKRKAQDKIEKACQILAQIKQSKAPSAKAQEMRTKLQSALTALTKQFAATVCRHYRKPVVWEPQFVEILMEKPERWITALGMYVRGIAKPIS